MALNPPAWAKNAVASPAGWRDVRTGELLKAQKMTAEQVAEANGVIAKPAKAKAKPKAKAESKAVKKPKTVKVKATKSKGDEVTPKRRVGRPKKK